MELVAQLTRIGFTTVDEAEFYLSLLRDNPVTGYQVAKETAAPRTLVRERLSHLYEQGAVLETPEGRTTWYRPLPLQMLLARHEADHSRMLARLSLDLDELYQVSDDDRVWSIEGRVSVLTYAARMIQYAESAIYLVLNDLDLNALHPEIEGACARNLSLNALLTGEGVIRCGRLAYHPALETESRDLGRTLLVAVEGVEVLISSNSPEEAMQATITRNNDVGNISRQLDRMRPKWLTSPDRNRAAKGCQYRNRVSAVL